MNKIYLLIILMALCVTGRANSASSDQVISGNWTFSLINMDSNSNVPEPQLTKIQAQYVNGEVYFTDPTIIEYLGGILPFFATYNESDNTLTFEKAYLQVTWEGYYPFQEPFVYNPATGEYSYQSITAQYDPAEGVITFDANNGIAWAKYEDATAENFQGYYYKYMISGAIKDKSSVSGDNEWRDVGNATLMDGWILPAFDINQNDKENWFEVPMQQNIGNPKLYRLVDPYHAPGFPLLNQNLSSRKGYIMIDVTDPENVVINGYKIDAGFVNYDVNCREFYCFNYLGSQVAKNPDLTVEQIKELAGNDMAFRTTFKDGVVTLSSKVGDTGFSNDANFANQDSYFSTGGMAWMDMNGLYLNMAAMIIFPGSNADDIDTDNPIIDGIYYLLNREDKTATVTGCNNSIVSLSIPSSITVKSGTYSVTSVAPFAFQGNTNLTSLSFDKGMETIGLSAFYHCDNVTSIILPEGLKTIDDFGFSYCNISEITLPESLTRIGAYAFAECMNVTKIYCPAIEVPTADYAAFADIDTTIPVFVPESSINAYKTANEWKDFTNYRALGSSAINSMEMESSNETVRYYNLQGIEVKDAKKGIFIRVKGSKSEIISL